MEDAWSTNITSPFTEWVLAISEFSINCCNRLDGKRASVQMYMAPVNISIISYILLFFFSRILRRTRLCRENAFNCYWTCCISSHNIVPQ